MEFLIIFGKIVAKNRAFSDNIRFQQQFFPFRWAEVERSRVSPFRAPMSIEMVTTCTSGVRRGVRGVSNPPRTGKNCCRKMMLFPKALFLETKFPKNDKNSILRLNFH